MISNWKECPLHFEVRPQTFFYNNFHCWFENGDFGIRLRTVKKRKKRSILDHLTLRSVKVQFISLTLVEIRKRFEDIYSILTIEFSRGRISLVFRIDESRGFNPNRKRHLDATELSHSCLIMRAKLSCNALNLDDDILSSNYPKIRCRLLASLSFGSKDLGIMKLLRTRASPPNRGNSQQITCTLSLTIPPLYVTPWTDRKTAAIS